MACPAPPRSRDRSGGSYHSVPSRRSLTQRTRRRACLAARPHHAEAATRPPPCLRAAAPCRVRGVHPLDRQRGHLANPPRRAENAGGTPEARVTHQAFVVLCSAIAFMLVQVAVFAPP